MYLQFLLPGILVQANVMITMNTGITLNTRHPEGGVRQVQVTSVWRPSPLVGALLGDVMRYLIGSAIVITLDWSQGFPAGGGAVGVVLSVVLLLVFSFCSSWLWDEFSSTLRTPTLVWGQHDGDAPADVREHTSSDLKTMPGWLQAVVEGSTRSTPGDRGTRPDARPGARRGNRLGARLVGKYVAVFGPITMVLYRNKKWKMLPSASTWSKSTPTTAPSSTPSSPVPGPDTTRRAE